MVSQMKFISYKNHTKPKTKGVNGKHTSVESNLINNISGYYYE